MSAFLAYSYLISAVMLIFSIRGVASPQTARKGNVLGIVGIIIAIGATILSNHDYDWSSALIAIFLGAIVGIFFAVKVKMTSLPQMVAIFNGLGGLSAVLISLSEVISGSSSFFNNLVGLVIGGLAFSGSMIAFAKLQGIIRAQAITFKGQQLINLLQI